MKATELIGIILGSGVVAALLNQAFDRFRLSRQFNHERRLRLDDMRRAAYFDYVTYFKQLPQHIVDGLVSYHAADAEAVNDLQRRVVDQAKAARTSLSFCASDAVKAVVDGKQQAALDGFTSAPTASADDIVRFAESLNETAAEHITPYLNALLDVMAKDFRE